MSDRCTANRLSRYSRQGKGAVEMPKTSDIETYPPGVAREHDGRVPTGAFSDPMEPAAT